jgi:hypothetical protein
MFRALREFLLLLGAAVLPLEASLVAIENSKLGTTAWRLSSTARAREIEGYASKVSVNRGESIDLFVSTSDPEYTIEIFRMGWYAGAGGRRMTGAIRRTGIRQPTPEPLPVTGMIECRWTDPYRLQIPASSDATDWMSGFYVGKLTAIPSGRQTYLIFVVRDAARSADLLFQSSVTTYQAYNNWGGKSLYSHSSAGEPSRKVSFGRPYSLQAGLGTGQFLNNGGWEYNMTRWLERTGYDVKYATNVDTHESLPFLQRAKAFLSVGHDEYWSWEMRSNVVASRDMGMHLGFFSANTAYWQIRFEPSSSAERNRVMVAYKEYAIAEDPYMIDSDPSNDKRVTTKWHRWPVLMPEAEFIGVQYIHNPVDSDVVISNADHWLFAGTGLKNGDRLQGVLGYEVDKTHASSPRNVEILARSPFNKGDGTSDVSEMSIYRAGSGAWVFATGTIQWAWGLDDYNAPSSRRPVEADDVKAVTRNVLSAFGAFPVPVRRRSGRF